jgi:hypothetical protein
LRVNYTGPGRNFPEIPEPPKPTVPITSIDQLVGTWDVEQKIFRYVGGGSFMPSKLTHTLTISKVDDKTIKIENFSGARIFYKDPVIGDDIKATINGNLEMIIPTNVELIPSWQGDGTSHFIPYSGSGGYGDGWNVPFPPQAFGKTADGDIVMRMNIDYLAHVHTGDPDFDGTYFFSSDVVWTKPASGSSRLGAPAAQPAAVATTRSLFTRADSGKSTGMVGINKGR